MTSSSPYCTCNLAGASASATPAASQSRLPIVFTALQMQNTIENASHGDAHYKLNPVSAKLHDSLGLGTFLLRMAVRAKLSSLICTKQRKSTCRSGYESAQLPLHPCICHAKFQIPPLPVSIVCMTDSRIQNSTSNLLGICHANAASLPALVLLLMQHK